MAASIGTIKSGTYAGPGSGTTVNITSVTQDAGSGGYMYLVIHHDQNYTPTAAYNGASMTKILSYNGQGMYTDVYQLANPSVGSYTMALTYSAYTEYTSNIGYMIVSCTNSIGYGNTATNSGAATSPGLACNIASVSIGSAILLIANVPSVTTTNTLTIDGSSTSSPTYNQTIPSSSKGVGWYKTNVSTGNCSIDTVTQNAAIVAIEIKGVSTTAPTVTTTAITSITRLTSSSGGNVTADGGSTVTDRGVCWNTSGTPTTSDSKTSDSSGTGVFTSSITGLRPGTTYYVRAYATNSVGTSYGSELNFKSLRRIINT